MKKHCFLLMVIIIFIGCQKNKNDIAQQNIESIKSTEVKTSVQQKSDSIKPAEIVPYADIDNVINLVRQADIDEIINNLMKIEDTKIQGIIKNMDINAILSPSYLFLDLYLRENNINTYLFYKPYNERVLNLFDDTYAFTDAVLVKADGENVIQYLIIYQNSLVKTNNNITFYDFSKSPQVISNGWLLEKKRHAFDGTTINALDLQLTNDGTNIIPADPPLPYILWDYTYNYPVRYENSMGVLPSEYHITYLGYEWHEDIKIAIARTGIGRTDFIERVNNYYHNNLISYLDSLSDYDRNIIINAIFALHGYEFETDEWKDYFSKYLWYKPDSIVTRSAEILDEYQKKLFEYLIE